MAVLGIDIGTGGSRAVIVDDAGRVLASSTQAHVPFDSPQTGWAEQDPADWWHAAQVAIRAVLTDGPVTSADVRAVGPSRISVVS
jgi:xylulokinase